MRYPFPSLRRSSLKTGGKTRATPRNGTHNDLALQMVWRHSYIPKRNAIHEECPSRIRHIGAPRADSGPWRPRHAATPNPGKNRQIAEHQTPRIYSASLSTFHTYRNSSLLDVAIASFF